MEKTRPKYSTNKVRIIIANLSLSRTRTKFCQLIASLSEILFRLKVTKLKLKFLKFDF